MCENEMLDGHGLHTSDLDRPPSQGLENNWRPFIGQIKSFVSGSAFSIINHSEPARVEAQLERLSEGRYLSPRRLDELLRGLPGVNAHLPEEEIQRLERLLPRTVSSETVRKINLLQENTEGHIPPLIQQIPAKFITGGIQKKFTPANFWDVWSRARLSDDNPGGDFIAIRAIDEEVTIGGRTIKVPRWIDTSMVGMFLTENVLNETKNAFWTDGRLRAYSAGWLMGSEGMWYPHQLDYQRERMGQGSEIGVDALFALLFRTLASGTREGLKINGMRMSSGHAVDPCMRLNESTRKGPYFINSAEDYLYIDDSEGDPGGVGIGASYKIS